MKTVNRPSLNLQAFTDDIENKNDDNWMISYIDVFVLMSTVFVMLLVLSRSESGEATLESLKDSVQVLPEHIVDVSDLALMDKKIPNERWMADISSSIQLNGLEKLVTLIKDANYTELAIQSRVLFSSGTSELTRSGEGLLEKLIPVLKDSEGLVFIEGHTDDHPIATSRFSSNWDLASARATEVLQFFVAGGLNKSRFRAVSYGDTKPYAPNSSEANRQKNRRVSLMIQRQI